MILQKKDMTFDIQDNAVKLNYHKINISFNIYNSPSKHAFNRFKQNIQNPNNFDDIADVLHLAVKCEVRGVGGMPITIHKTIAY